MLGMVMRSLMLLAAAGRTALAARGHPFAAPLLAGMAGFVVGGVRQPARHAAHDADAAAHRLAGA